MYSTSQGVFTSLNIFQINKRIISERVQLC